MHEKRFGLLWFCMEISMLILIYNALKCIYIVNIVMFLLALKMKRITTATAITTDQKKSLASNKI